MGTRRMGGRDLAKPQLMKKHNKRNTKTTMEVELVTKPIVICYCENHN
jgi:hypothetical protein